jgi:predicted GNAT family acetyltransferase
MADIVDNTAAGRFEVEEQGLLAHADYTRANGRLVVTYVHAAPGLRGTGAAGRLMEGVLAAARRDGLKVTPVCGYAAAYMRRHKEHHDLLG